MDLSRNWIKAKMFGKTVIGSILILILAASCQSGNFTSSIPDETVPSQQVTQLICGSQTNCLSEICEDIQNCPLVLALSNPVVFDFVKTYSICEGCAVPEFSTQDGIGKCIEYEVTRTENKQVVNIWVSAQCNFRYADPVQTSLFITVDTEKSAINKIKPAVEYIQDPSYCKMESDCRALSGSGVPFIGCSNFFYAPLNWSGYAVSDTCACKTNQCQEK